MEHGGPGHSSEECNLLKSYSNKYAIQRHHKDNESRSERKKILVSLFS